MEKSVASSMSKGNNSEVSGWTWYLEDFSASEKGEEGEGGDGSSSSAFCGSSMVSDAASYAAWKFPNPAEASGTWKRLSFKKRKGRDTLDDDLLEDTASSPANSPKVSDLNHNDVMIKRKTDDNKDVPKEKDVGNEEYAEMKGNEISVLDVLERTNEPTELKKRGLCLVPLSMFADHLG